MTAITLGDVGSLLIALPIAVIAAGGLVIVTFAGAMALGDLLIPSRRRQLDGLGAAGALLVVVLLMMMVGGLLIVADRGSR